MAGACPTILDECFFPVGSGGVVGVVVEEIVGGVVQLVSFVTVL